MLTDPFREKEMTFLNESNLLDFELTAWVEKD